MICRALHRNSSAALSIAIFLLLGACAEPSGRTEDSITDKAFLSSPLWDDGQAEVAFYRVHRSRNQYGEAEEQDFLVGSYLVKHDFDPDAEAKASGDTRRRVEAFKYALFYELESGSYQYKRSYVTNARRSDLRPMKSSFTSFDWCSNQYREFSFDEAGAVEYLMRSDDYGNARRTFDYASGSYPPAMLALVVRGLDLRPTGEIPITLLLESGRTIGATATVAGRDSVTTPAGTFAAHRIEVHYAEAAPSPVAEVTDAHETYWIADDEGRTLLRLESESGRYEMELVERLRSAYWDDDVYERLERVDARP